MLRDSTACNISDIPASGSAKTSWSSCALAANSVSPLFAASLAMSEATPFPSSPTKADLPIWVIADFCWSPNAPSALTLSLKFLADISLMSSNAVNFSPLTIWEVVLDLNVAKSFSPTIPEKFASSKTWVTLFDAFNLSEIIWASLLSPVPILAADKAAAFSATGVWFLVIVLKVSLVPFMFSLNDALNFDTNSSSMAFCFSNDSNSLLSLAFSWSTKSFVLSAETSFAASNISSFIPSPPSPRFKPSKFVNTSSSAFFWLSSSKSPIVNAFVASWTFFNLILWASPSRVGSAAVSLLESILETISEKLDSNCFTLCWASSLSGEPAAAVLALARAAAAFSFSKRRLPEPEVLRLPLSCVNKSPNLSEEVCPIKSSRLLNWRLSKREDSSFIVASLLILSEEVIVGFDLNSSSKEERRTFFCNSVILPALSTLVFLPPIATSSIILSNWLLTFLTSNLNEKVSCSNKSFTLSISFLTSSASAFILTCCWSYSIWSSEALA